MRRNRSSFISLIFLAYSLLFCSNALGIGNSDKTSLPFNKTERLIYEGEFSKLMLRGINIVEIEFTANSSIDAKGCNCQTSSSNLVQYTSDTRSKGWFAKLFGLTFRFKVESLFDPSTFTTIRTKTVDIQGSRQRTSETIFDRTNNKITWTELDPKSPTKPPHVVTIDLKDTSFDFISGLYFLRTQTLVVGKTVDVTLHDSGKVYTIPVKVIKRERLKTIFGRINTVMVEVGAFGKDRLADRDGSFHIWFTDDSRHIPVRSVIKTDLGEVVLKLKRYSS
jgi:hypothetical protein